MYLFSNLGSKWLGCCNWPDRPRIYMRMMVHDPDYEGGARPPGDARTSRMHQTRMHQDSLDLWVRRSLRTSLASVLDEPVPDELRKLAERLLAVMPGSRTSS